MLDGTKGSHKQGGGAWLDVDGECSYPINKKGKVYIIDNVQYQQACRWVVRQFT